MDVVSYPNWKSSRPIHGDERSHLIRSACVLAFVTLLSLWSVGSHAQRGFHLGGQIGGHHSWLFNEREGAREDLKRLFTPGMSVGGEATFYVTPFMGVGMEFLFSYQGQRYREDLRVDRIERSVRLSYFKVPLKLELRTNLGGGTYFKGAFGPYISTPLSVSRSRKGETVESPGDGTWKEAYRSSVMGFMGALGPGKRWGRGWATSLEFRFDHDLTNAEEKGSALIPNYRPETYNATLSLSLRVRYAFQEQAASRKSGYP